MGCQDDKWECFNKALLIALSNTENYPEQTTFLSELSNALLATSGEGRIDWDIMRKVDAKITECRKKLKDPVFEGMEDFFKA